MCGLASCWMLARAHVEVFLPQPVAVHGAAQQTAPALLRGEHHRSAAVAEQDAGGCTPDRCLNTGPQQGSVQGSSAAGRQLGGLARSQRSAGPACALRAHICPASPQSARERPLL